MTQPPARTTGPTLGVCVALACAATPLLLMLTAGRPLWLDEAASATMAQLPRESLRRVLLDREGNGLLHTLLLRGWQQVLPGDQGLRALSVVAAVTAVVLLALLADRLLRRRVAVLVPPLLVGNPMFVRYAVEARSYALLLALACASGLLLARAVERPSTGRWLAYALVSGLAVYAQYFAVLMVAGHVLAVLALRPRGLRLRHLVPAAAVYVALLAPLPRLMTESAAGGVGYLSGSPLVRALPVLLVVAAAAAGAALVVLLRRRPRGQRLPLRLAAERWPAALLASWLLTPVVLAVLLSLLREPVLAPRYFMVCLPPAVLLLAWLVSRLPAVAAAAAVAVTCAGGLAVGTVWLDRHTEAWDEVAAHVARTSDAGDQVLFVAPYVRIPYERYLPATTAAEPAYPVLPWGSDLSPLLFYTPLPQEEVATAVTGADDVHLVVSHVGLYDTGDAEYGRVVRALARAGFVLVDEQTFQGAVVQRWSGSTG